MCDHALSCARCLMPMSRRSPLCFLLTLGCACGDPAAGSTGEVDSSSGGGTVSPTGATSADPSGPEPTSAADTTGSGTGGATQGETGGSSSGEPQTTGLSPDMGSPPQMFGRCGDEPPEGATLAPEIPKYGGTCPVLETGYADGQMP